MLNVVLYIGTCTYHHRSMKTKVQLKAGLKAIVASSNEHSFVGGFFVVFVLVR